MLENEKKLIEWVKTNPLKNAERIDKRDAPFALIDQIMKDAWKNLSHNSATISEPKIISVNSIHFSTISTLYLDKKSSMGEVEERIIFFYRSGLQTFVLFDAKYDELFPNCTDNLLVAVGDGISEALDSLPHKFEYSVMVCLACFPKSSLRSKTNTHALLSCGL